MDLQKHIHQLFGLSGDHQTIQAALALSSITDDLQVMDALCEAAVYTTSHKVREALIEVLKKNPAGACLRFSDYALWSENPSCRKWALVNLSLMGCREAKEAVMQGLSDPHPSVRRAAAMSTGLYDDKDVLNAQERYFESHRFGLTMSFLGDSAASLKTRKNDSKDSGYTVKTVDALWPNA